MSQTAVIQGNTVVFQNPYSEQDITLQHKDPDNYKLIFNSEVEFKKEFTLISVKFGNMEILKDGDNMVFKRDDQILMILN